MPPGGNAIILCVQNNPANGVSRMEGALTNDPSLGQTLHPKKKRVGEYYVGSTEAFSRVLPHSGRGCGLAIHCPVREEFIQHTEGHDSFGEPLTPLSASEVQTPQPAWMGPPPKTHVRGGSVPSAALWCRVTSRTGV